MRYASIRTHLRPYMIVARRRTTINHAFAAAIAPADEYDEGRVKIAMEALGQNPDNDLECAYCGAPAETWDHIFATVLDSKFSGHGHRLGNLLPCCKPCNSKKGNKSWRHYLNTIKLTPGELEKRSVSIENYIKTYEVTSQPPEHSAAHVKLQEIRAQVLALLHQADHLAAEVRSQENKQTEASHGWQQSSSGPL